MTVRLPSAEREDRFYDLARFQVINVNPKIDREVAMTRAGMQAGLQLELPGDGYVQTDGEIRLKGSIQKGRSPTGDGTGGKGGSGSGSTCCDCRKVPSTPGSRFFTGRESIN